jgi:hypothetical protein
MLRLFHGIICIGKLWQNANHAQFHNGAGDGAIILHMEPCQPVGHSPMKGMLSLDETYESVDVQ